MTTLISRKNHSPRIIRVNGEEFARREGETVPDLTDRALQEYRTRFNPVDQVSVLIVDCPRQPPPAES